MGGLAFAHVLPAGDVQQPARRGMVRAVRAAEERSRLVYRVKVSVDNRKGVLKQGMPVEAELPLQ